MSVREAIEVLSSRAQKLALRLYFFAAIALFVGFLAIAGVVFVGQLMLWGAASIKVTGVVASAVTFGIGAPIGRYLVKRTVGFRRRGWIEDIASTEGLNAKELEQYFMLDSW
jgi:hypothetical protein